MENQLFNTIKELQQREQRLKSLDDQIENGRNENQKYLLEEKQRRENILRSLVQESEEEAKKLSTLFDQNVVSIALSDLIEELSKLSGISILNMKISVDFESTIYCGSDVSFSKDMLENAKLEYFSGKNSANNTVSIHILGDNTLEEYEANQPFSYEITYPLNLREPQADGKTFFEHCSCHYNGLSSYSVQVDRRIGDIICHIDMEKVIRGDEYNWKPSSLLMTAIMNCVEQGKYIDPTISPKEKQKVLN
ncbi:MAG: hypothetical protein HFH08_04935 [Bacilli bacterium]|nr:hypothetical protein [Bacilli bacterium]